MSSRRAAQLPSCGQNEGFVLSLMKAIQHYASLLSQTADQVLRKKDQANRQMLEKLFEFGDMSFFVIRVSTIPIHQRQC